MRKDVKSKTLSGIIWRLAERIGAQGITFLVSIILARLLDPDDYGLIAMVTVFLTISNVFIDSGLGVSLIQKKDADDLDFSTVFYFNIVLCIILYIIMFIAAPFIADFYHSRELTRVLRVLSITIIISSVKNIQHSYVSRHMLFRKFFYSTLGGTIIAAIIGIIMAYMGCGVWALVAQQLINSFIDTVILWFTVKWRPIKAFSIERLRSLFSYGWKVFASAMLNTVYDNLRQLIIGKVYTSEDLAFYNRGRQFPHFIVYNLNTAIDSVLFPVMADAQDDFNRVKAMTRKSIRISSYVLWPIMLGFCIVAEPFTRLVLTEKWMPIVPYLIVFCISGAFQPIHTANLNAVKAVGRSDLYLKLEVKKKIIGMAIIFISMPFGPFFIAIGQLAYNVIAQLINASPNRKLLGYGYIDQLKDIFPYTLIASIMACCIYPIKFLGFNDWLTLFLQIFVGAIVYLVESKLFKLEIFDYVLDIVKNSFKRKG